MQQNIKKKPILNEYIDEQGKKWVQTSTEDIFSLKELNDVIKSIETDRKEGEIVLAHIDFKKVNKEYYDSIIMLQDIIKKKNLLLKKIEIESKSLINKKNKKMIELIEYIKELHKIISHLQTGGQVSISSPDNIFDYKKKETESIEEEIVYEKVQEIPLDDNGNEIEQ